MRRLSRLRAVHTASVAWAATALVGVALVITPPDADASGVTVVKASDDAFVKSSSASEPKGAKPYLSAGERSVDGVRYVYLKFTLDGSMSANGRALLRLETISGNDRPLDVYVSQSNAWSESTITWNNRPKELGSPVGRMTTVKRGEWTSVDVTPAVKSGGTITLVLRSPDGDRSQHLNRYASREMGAAPRLELLGPVTPTNGSSVGSPPLTTIAPSVTLPPQSAPSTSTTLKSTTTTTAATKPAQGGTTNSATLAWAPPALTNPTTIVVTKSNNVVSLDPAKDFIIQMPATALTAPGGLSISGGRNVVLIGGRIQLDAVGSKAGVSNRGLYLKNWTGTMHIEGLHIAGSALGEGIDIDTRSAGAVLQIENVRIDTVHGTQATNHADLIQNWGGPSVYRVDHLTGSTTYQGFMVQPQQFGGATDVMDFRNINVTNPGTASGYKFFRAAGVRQLTFTNVYFQPSAGATSKIGYPNADPAYAPIHAGLAPKDFVPASAVGLGYRTPGYR